MSDDRIRVQLDDGRIVEAEHTPRGARARVDGGPWRSARTLSDALHAVGAPTGTTLILQGLARAREAIEAAPVPGETQGDR